METGSWSGQPETRWGLGRRKEYLHPTPPATLTLGSKEDSITGLVAVGLAIMLWVGQGQYWA